MYFKIRYLQSSSREVVLLNGLTTLARLVVASEVEVVVFNMILIFVYSYLGEKMQFD